MVFQFRAVGAGARCETPRSNLARFGIDRLGWTVTAGHRRVRFLHRRIAETPTVMKWWIAVGASVLVGWADLAWDSEIAFPLLYLLPVAFASWFMRSWDAMVVAAICAALGVAVALKSEAGHFHPSIRFGSAGVRMAVFCADVLVVTFVARSIGFLARGALQRARSLRDEARRRRRLEREILEVSARERLRLAQDLHDGIGQYLSALALHARMLADDLNQSQSSHAGQAERIVAVVRKTNQITRQINRALQVPESNAEGLVAALRVLATEFEQLTGVRCEMTSEQPAPALDEFHTTMLFRIVQEALNNSVKHARPQTIRVSLVHAEDSLSVTVVNDGYGKAVDAAVGAGAGSLVMRLRAELMGARFESGPMARGEYKVECVLPLTALGRSAVLK